MNPSYRPRQIRIWLAIILIAALLGLYLYFYQFNPFPEGVADLVTSGMTAFASITAAAVSILVARRYGTGTPPRLIWLYFSLALCGWAIAETIWVYEYYTGGSEAASLSLADLFWIVSYILFILSLFQQYMVIFRPVRRVALAYLGTAIAAVLIFTYLYGIWLLASGPQAGQVETFVNAFYAVGDIALAIGAFVIALAFRDGALARPWLGLLVFAFSDLLYAWLEASGLYAWSISQGNLLTTITDVSYFAAYLLVAFGCYLQLILLTYGPRLRHDQ